MLRFLNPRSPSLMLRLCHDKLPKVVPSRFTTLNRGRGGDEVCSVNVYQLCNFDWIGLKGHVQDFRLSPVLRTEGMLWWRRKKLCLYIYIPSLFSRKALTSFVRNSSCFCNSSNLPPSRHPLHAAVRQFGQQETKIISKNQCILQPEYFMNTPPRRSRRIWFQNNWQLEQNELRRMLDERQKYAFIILFKWLNIYNTETSRFSWEGGDLY